MVPPHPLDKDDKRIFTFKKNNTDRWICLLGIGIYYKYTFDTEIHVKNPKLLCFEMLV
jgi:hypothetical protein